MPISYDKRLHFSVCFLITLFLFPIISWWGAGTALFTGVLKELYDWKDYGQFSWGDIRADTIGVIVAAIIIVIIKLIIS